MIAYGTFEHLIENYELDAVMYDNSNRTPVKDSPSKIIVNKKNSGIEFPNKTLYKEFIKYNTFRKLILQYFEEQKTF